MQDSNSSDGETESEIEGSELSDCASELEPLNGVEMGQARALCADFTRERVLAVLSGAERPSGKSAAAKRATSKSRVNQVLRAGGGCRCSRQCGRQFSPHRLLAVVVLFWQLPKQAQDALLWSMAGQRMQQDDEQAQGYQERNKRHLWSLDGPLSLLREREKWKKRNCSCTTPLAGLYVCRHAFCYLLGIGNCRLNRATSTFGGKDLRFGRVQGLQTQIYN
jgi:hypothetical protein